MSPLKDDEEYVFYEAESLFTNTPIDYISIYRLYIIDNIDHISILYILYLSSIIYYRYYPLYIIDNISIDYILEQIYVHYKLRIICSKLIFRRLLQKVTTENLFQLNSKFFKQGEGCAMGGPLSVTLSGIWMVKMENNIVIPHKPILYKRYVDDIVNRRKKYEEDLLSKKLNNYHHKIKLTTEINPPNFLDTEIIISNKEVVISVHRKESKLPVRWESKPPKHYKSNSLLGEINHAKKVSSNFQREVKTVKEKFSKENFPLRFINSVVAQFNNSAYNNNERNKEDEMINPPQFFEIPMKILLLHLPFCEANES